MNKINFTKPWILLVGFSSLCLFAQNEVCFEIESNLSDPDLSYFTKYVNVLNCFKIYAESSISDAKLLNVAAISAELLDNNELYTGLCLKKLNKVANFAKSLVHSI